MRANGFAAPSAGPPKEAWANTIGKQGGKNYGSTTQSFSNERKQDVRYHD